MKAIIPILALLLFATFTAYAEQFGLFSYKVRDGEVTITSYPKDALGDIEIPSEIHGLTVTAIGSRTSFGNLSGAHGAFSGCTGLTSVVIPHSITSIGREAFYGCTSLVSVSIPHSVNSIGSSAFYGCANLNSVSIPHNITSINSNTFFGCTSLTSVSIPDNVTEISYEAFSGCASLTSIFIHNSITSIRYSAFQGCNGLITIDVDVLNPNYSSLNGIFFNKNRTTLIQFPAGKSGGYHIPDSVTEIGNEAFSGCTGLASLSIPDSVTDIGYSAFYGCIDLTSILIPRSVTSIGDRAFRGCTGLTAIEVDTLNPNYSSLNGVLFDKDRSFLIQYPAEKLGPYTVPNTVTSINSISWHVDWHESTLEGQGAFEGNSKLTTISIPDSVTSIGGGTFRGCSALSTINIPASVTSILDPGAGAFEDCTSLHSALFLGDAPSRLDEKTFANTSPDFTIYYLSTSTGFTSPTWNGYPTVMLDESSYPAAPWLVSHGLPQDTDLNHDLNNDGVSILMAYALDLDPNENLSQHMLAPVLVDDSLTLTFHAAAPGVSYTVETSTDLKNWTTDGVAISDLDSNKQRTASVPRDAPRRYLRLVISETPSL